MRLYDHQRRGADLLIANPRYALFWDCGVGKTMTVLTAMTERPMRTVVVCPRAIIDAAWLSDAQNFPSVRVVSGRETSPARRRAIIAGQWDVLVLNFDIAKKHIPELLKAGVRRLVVDESSAMKNPNSQQTKACLELAAACEECWLLSGTPAPNGEHEYWAQLRAIGATTRNFWQFCGIYMVPLKRWVRDREVTVGWRMRSDRKTEFENLLASRSWSLRKEQCLDLPEKIDTYREFDLSKEERTIYDSILMECKADFDGETIGVQLSAKLMKLRQITGGNYYMTTPYSMQIQPRRIERETGLKCPSDPKSVRQIGDSKLNELMAALEEIGPQPVVIWAEFTADIDRIEDALLKIENAGCGVIDGRTPDHVRTTMLENFGKSLRYLVCHPKAVGHGITLTQASYAIYYSMGFSYETYAQSKDRIHRIGQKKPCTYIHLVASDTCDKRVIEVLTQKGSAMDAMRAALDGSNADGSATSGSRTHCVVSANAV